MSQHKGNTGTGIRLSVGQALRDIRTAQRRSMRDVSAHAGISLGHLGEVETGKKQASYTVLSNIADALGITMPSLLRMVADRLEQQDTGERP